MELKTTSEQRTLYRECAGPHPSNFKTQLSDAGMVELLDDIATLQAEVAQLRKELASAKKQGMEEAAKIADMYLEWYEGHRNTAKNAAEEIRARIAELKKEVK